MSGAIQIEWTRIITQRMQVTLSLDAVRAITGLVGTPDDEMKLRLWKLLPAKDIIDLAGQLHVAPEVIRDEANDDPSNARERLTAKIVQRADISNESAMNQIQTILRDPEWSMDTLNEVRDVVHLTGRSTEDPDA